MMGKPTTQTKLIKELNKHVNDNFEKVINNNLQCLKNYKMK